MPYKGKNHTYQTVLLDSIQHLANFILGKQKTLTFNIPAIDLKRTDTLELQQRILAISPSERRRLGINKSTLWYQRKKVERGKKINLYRKTLSKIG